MPEQDRAALRSMAQALLSEATLSVRDVELVVRSGDQSCLRKLASHPACTAEQLVWLAEAFPAEVLGNPAFEFLAIAEPGFLNSIPPTSLKGLLLERDAPQLLVDWSIGNCQWLESKAPGISDALALHPKTTSEGLARLSVSEITALHSRSPFVGRMPWRTMLRELPRRIASSPAARIPAGELATLAALARHGLFSGSCPAVAGMIRAAGAEACITVLLHHPSLSGEVASWLTEPAAISWINTHQAHGDPRGSMPASNPTREPMIDFLRAKVSKSACGSADAVVAAEIEDLRRQGAADALFPSVAARTVGSIGWSAVETAFIAQRSGEGQLAKILLHASPRCADGMIDLAAQSANWWLRLAAAVNPSANATVRTRLSRDDACWIVRDAASEAQPEQPKRAAWLREELDETCLAAPERAHLMRVRKHLGSRAELDPRLVFDASCDAAIAHFVLGGVLDQPVRASWCGASPIASIASVRRRGEIASLVVAALRERRETTRESDLHAG